jgi:hypothetical protein
LPESAQVLGCQSRTTVPAGEYSIAPGSLGRLATAVEQLRKAQAVS